MGAVIVIVVPLFAALMIFAARHAKEQQRAITADWQAFAAARGLRYLPAEGPWHRRKSGRIKGRVDGVDLTIDTYTESTTDSNGDTRHSTYTRLSARAETKIDVTARIYRTHALSGLGKLLGFQDVPTGDATFDDAFVVKASDEERVRALLGEPMRRALLAFSRHPSMRYERGELTLSWSGHERKHAVFDEAIAIAVAACGIEAGAYR